MPKPLDHALPQYSSISNEMRSWEAALAPLHKFLKLSPDNRDLFFALLGKEKDEDTYATSPVYYALTGRKGLWIYQDGNTFIPLCWHPNVEGQILLFPPRGKENPDILKRLLTELPIPPMGLRIARVKKQSKTPSWLNDIKGTDERSVFLTPVQEHVLDWRYPVRVLSSEVVSEMKGHDFMRIRNSVRQAKLQNIQVERLNPNHKTQILSFAYRWANRRTEDIGDLINLMEPYKEILNLLDDESFNLGGLVFNINGHIQAVTIWERPNTQNRVANAWVNLSNISIRGISEFMTVKIAETLWAENIPYFNFGGSETRSLDDYKKKYIPAYSVDLQSIEAILDGTDFILDSLLKFRTLKATA